MRSVLCAAVFMMGLAACDTGQAEVELERQKAPPSTKPARPKMTPEELEAARRAAGFVDQDEVAEQNITAMKKGEREQVKAQLDEYRALLASTRGLVERMQTNAEKWAKAKKPQKAFDQFSDKYKTETEALDQEYKELLEGGSQIDVQAKMVGLQRAFEELNGSLSPEIAADEAFGKSVESIRAQLDELEKELTAIEKDESLKAAAAPDDAP